MREIVGTESRELTRYKEKMEQRARKEEELFTRAPLTKMEKKKEKHLRKSRNGYVPYNIILNLHGVGLLNFLVQSDEIGSHLL